MNFLILLFKFLPVIIQAVMALEMELASAGSGLTKKQIILDVIEIAVKAGESIDNKTVQAIAQMIDKVVTALNGSGVFKKPVTPAAPKPVIAGQ